MAKRRKPPVAAPSQSETASLIESAIASRRVRLELYEENQDWIAIKGSRESLRFLGKLLVALAEEGDGPNSLYLDNPGQDLFAPRTAGYAPSHGLALYRTK
jgi:hypothetical protein